MGSKSTHLEENEDPPPPLTEKKFRKIWGKKCSHSSHANQHETLGMVKKLWKAFPKTWFFRGIDFHVTDENFLLSWSFIAGDSNTISPEMFVRLIKSMNPWVRFVSEIDMRIDDPNNPAKDIISPLRLINTSALTQLGSVYGIPVLSSHTIKPGADSYQYNFRDVIRIVNDLIPLFCGNVSEVTKNCILEKAETFFVTQKGFDETIPYLALSRILHRTLSPAGHCILDADCNPWYERMAFFPFFRCSHLYFSPGNPDITGKMAEIF
jgi:hypothetical protein